MLNRKESNRKHRPTRSRPAHSLGVLLGIALGGGLLSHAPAQAVEYKLTAGLSTEHSDNIERSSGIDVPKEDDWIHTPTLRGQLSHDTANLRASADYLVEHRIYTEDFFDDRTRFTGRANLQWDAIQDRLQFNASNSRTEATQDALGQDVETNRQVSTVTSAGPTLLLRPRTSDLFALEYQFSDVVQEETDSDSQRQLIAASYKLGLTENRSVLFEVSRDNVDFKRDDSPELDIDTASVTYSSKGIDLDFDLRGGYTTIDRSLNRSKVNGAIGSIDLTWRSSGNGQLKVSASRTINDQSNDVLRGNAQFGQGSVFQNTEINEVFTEDILRLTYNHRWGRNIASIGYSLQNQDFEDIAASETQSRDQDENGLNLAYARRMTPKINLQMSARFMNRDFKDRGVSEDYITADARINWRAGQRINLFAGASYEERDGTGGTTFLGNQFLFDEFRFSFGMTIDIVNRTQLIQQR